MSAKAPPGYINSPEKLKLHRLIEERPQQPSSYKQLAALLRADGNHAAAVAVLRRGLRRHPADHGIASHLARTYLDAGDSRAAIALYRRIIRQHPHDPVCYEKLERIYRDIGDPGRAVKLYRAIKAKSPLKERSHERIHFLLADKMRDFRGAAANLREAIRRFGPTYRRCKDLGRLYGRLGKWREAARCYAEALEIRKNDVDLCALLGWALTECGDFAEAEKCFSRISGTFQGGVSLAELSLRQGRLEEAEAQFQSIGRAYPASPRIAIGMADIRLRRGDAASARRSCEEALRRVPPYFAFEQAHAHEVLAAACRRLGDTAAARRHREFAAALRKGPDTYTALVTLAEAKIAAKDAGGAEAVLTRLLELYPGNTRALLGQCEVCLLRKDRRQAVFFAERALAGVNPKYAAERTRCELLLRKAKMAGSNRHNEHFRNPSREQGGRSAASRRLPHGERCPQ